MTDLTVTTNSTAAGPVLAVAGDLDFDTAAALRAAVAALALLSGQTLTLDLAALTFCDSSGIAALIAARNHAQTQGADTVLANTPADTVRVLRFVGLDQIFHIQAGAASAGAGDSG